jgi:uncharacterized protein (DUF885 family)
LQIFNFDRYLCKTKFKNIEKKIKIRAYIIRMPAQGSELQRVPVTVMPRAAANEYYTLVSQRREKKEHYAWQISR